MMRPVSRAGFDRPWPGFYNSPSLPLPATWSFMKTTRLGRFAQAAALGAIPSRSGCSASGTFTLPADPMVGQPAPKFTFHSVHKRSFPSTNFMGKTLVIVFMRPGQVELPSLLRDLEMLHRNPAYA